MEKKKFNKDTSILMELIRFVIIGVYGTLIDFAIEGWVTSMVNKQTENMGHLAAFFVMFAISIVGFLVATPATWSLTSIWGFRNVEKEAEAKSRSLKGGLWFTFYAFLGLVIGAIIQFLGYMICLEWTSWNINILGGFSFEKMFNVDGGLRIFFAWFVVLCIRTVFTMTFNYLTRKFILYKAPKAEEKDGE
ncbi:MAG: hypothetical protein IJS37_05870 [Bacilli bacterium]|nr:hypothetical protein [Bacilli bacterium]